MMIYVNIVCVLKAHVKYTMNKKNNQICENMCPIKLVFKLFSSYKYVVNMCS